MMDNNLQGFKELPTGTALNAGKYIIERKIGEGGFGITYKAVQSGLNRPVCIKEYFLSGHCMRNTQARTVQLQGISVEKYEKFRLAFVKEAQTVASLHHPNIVEVIDIFDENNTSYMVMSFIEGRSLQSIVEANGPLSYPDAVNYMAQITNAVGYIHEHNILHRDIKPENIMITADYKAILIDFGSAREFEQDKTQMHTTMLTHGYAPPEQYTANSRKGAYTDIYALGATLYFILTGRVPTEAAARLTEELVEPQKLNPSIPSEGNRTIMKAMKLKPEERYQHAQDFMNDMRNTNQGAEPSNLKPKKEDSEPSPKKKSFWIWIVVALVVLLGGALVTSVFLPNKPDKETVELYNKAVDDFDEHLRRINNPEDLTGRAPVIEALKSLETIETLENKKGFLKAIGKEKCYEEKVELYKQKIDAENALIDSAMYYFEDDKDTYSTDYQELKKKRSMNTIICTQLKQTGSAKAVVQKLDSMRNRK